MRRNLEVFCRFRRNAAAAATLALVGGGHSLTMFFDRVNVVYNLEFVIHLEAGVKFIRPVFQINKHF